MPKRKIEKVNQQSAAEFFTEHQQIAGFDNPGKSLFTTIRELVENSLDAAESIYHLPDIEVTIQEFTEAEHNTNVGIDIDPFKKKKAKSPKKVQESQQSQQSVIDLDSQTSDMMGISQLDDSQMTNTQMSQTSTIGTSSQPTSVSKGKKEKIGTASKQAMYYTITVRDNGCGIRPQDVGNMLGRVLSGSKHGIRQTRGKFGLGAKMALIWSKKSSGLPIQIKTCHIGNNRDHKTFIETPAEYIPPVTEIVLDMDIYENQPRIISKTEESNDDKWHGVEMKVTIIGNWSAYKMKVLQYFQQLAVITPVANFKVKFECQHNDKKSFEVQFHRRSNQMPPIPTEIKPHPKSLNNITLANLLKESQEKNAKFFLTKDLSGVTPSVATKIVTGLGIEDRKPFKLGEDAGQVMALKQVLRDEKGIRDPTADCLSPAGEYNMRLGVIKELKPNMVATYTEKAGACDGHAFLVEAAVSLGGTTVREGVNIYRFANRIPLLFEPGADVVTDVAMKKINWNSYHIDQKKEHIGVYVSIVSTRIPFKGTSKEYIGADVDEIKSVVKKAIAGCCLQLKTSLAKRMHLVNEQSRKKVLCQYIPNIVNALSNVTSKLGPAGKKIISNLMKNGGKAEEGNKDDMITDLLTDKLTKVVDHFDANEGELGNAIDDVDDGKASTRKAHDSVAVDFRLPIRDDSKEHQDSLQWLLIKEGLMIAVPPSSLLET